MAVSILILIIVLLVIFWQLSLLLATIFGSPTVYAYVQAITDSLQLAKVRKDDFVVDLGCGDGRSLIIAAKKFGARGLGVERSPYCYLRARLEILMSGQRRNIKIVFGDFKKIEKELKQADTIYLYLLNSTLSQIEDWFFQSIGSKTRVVSLAFQFKKHKPVDKTETWNLGKKATARLYRK